MTMPADAIATILGIRTGPAHLWPCSETVTGGAPGGADFTDQAGAKHLSAAAGCAPNGWGPLRGYRNNGGPLTAGPTFDGSTTGHASAAGPTLATLGGWDPSSPGGKPGASLLIWMDALWGNLASQCFYSEASATSTERIALYVDGASGNLALRYADASAGVTTLGAGNVVGVSGGQSFVSGATINIRGGQLLGAVIQPDGSVQFYRNCKSASALSANKLPLPAGGSWTDPTIKTYVGRHPSVTGSFTASVIAAVQGTSAATSGANEQDGNLLYIDATATTNWLPGGSGPIPIKVGSDYYSIKTAALLGSNVLLTLTTNLKADVAPGAAVTTVPYAAFRGTLAWTTIFPFALTPTEFDTVYQSLTPEPANGPAWVRSRSGPAVPPRSSLWRSKLEDNAALHPHSADIIAYWQATATGSLRPAMTNAVPHIDLDHAGVRLNPDSNPAITRDEFLSNPDQTTFLSRMPVADGGEPQGPLPGLSGSDAQQGKTSPRLGLHAANFHSFALGDSQHEPRAPMWFGRIKQAAPSAGGTLPIGNHYYSAATIQADGSESTCVGFTDTGATLFVGAGVLVALSSIGSATFQIDVLMGPAGYYYKPTALRIYHNATGKLKDYRQRGPDIPISGNGIQTFSFTDNGSLADVATKRPFGYVHGIGDPTVQRLVSAVYPTGKGTPGSGVPIAFDPMGVATAGNVIPGTVMCGAVPLPGAPVRGADFSPGTKVAASPAPTQTTFYVTQATTGASGSGGQTIHVGDWTPPLTTFGQAGTARGRDEAVTGGGGTWSWWANMGFLESWRPSGTNNNGPSATSCPEGPGFITCDELARAAAGDLHAIDHPVLIAIGVGIQSGLGSASWWPAKRYDGTDTAVPTAGSYHPYTTKEGMLFRFPASSDPSDPAFYASALPTDPLAANVVMAICYAIRDYGLRDRDSTTGKGFGNLYIEDRPQSGRDSNGPWFAGYGTGSGEPNILTPIPWASLQLLRTFRYASKTKPDATVTADTNATATLHNVSDFTNIWPGKIVTGADIQARTSILSIDTGAGTATMSRPATGTHTGQTITPQSFTARIDTPTRIIDPNFEQLAPS